MDVQVVLSALLGAILGGIFLAIIVFTWDVLDRRRIRGERDAAKRHPLTRLTEARIEEHIVENFNVLFPGWRIFGSREGEEQSGVQFRTAVGIIDILAIDDDENFVVVELKRRKAPDKTVAQVDRYITWVERKLAKKRQKVRGLIVAASYGSQIEHILSQRDNIKAFKYRWNLALEFQGFSSRQSDA